MHHGRAHPDNIAESPQSTGSPRLPGSPRSPVSPQIGTGISQLRARWLLTAAALTVLVSACDGSSNQVPPPPTAQKLTWDSGHWDDADWQ
jgi:hypothetical protein